MSTIPPVSASTPSAKSTSADKTGTAADKAAIAASATELENRFLTLLVSQLRNQDPLNPLDNAQLTSQLAQISTVGGIDHMNETLTSIATLLAEQNKSTTPKP